MTSTDLGRPADPASALSTALAPGFENPVHDAQRTFRALLDAFGRPTTAVALPCPVSAPVTLTRGAAALVLTLVGDSTPLWLDPFVDDPAVAAWVTFHTGARFVADPSLAAFALVATPQALPALDRFALGSDEAPHTSTTVVVMTARPSTGPLLGADGPGFPVPSIWHAPALPRDFAAQWARNTARFPRGVDLVLAGDETFVALPRTTRLTPVKVPDRRAEAA